MNSFPEFITNEQLQGYISVAQSFAREDEVKITNPVPCNSVIRDMQIMHMDWLEGSMEIFVAVHVPEHEEAPYRIMSMMIPMQDRQVHDAVFGSFFADLPVGIRYCDLLGRTFLGYYEVVNGQERIDVVEPFRGPYDFQDEVTAQIRMVEANGESDNHDSADIEA